MNELDILDNAIHVLGNITIPVGWTEKIGVPLYNVGQNLIMLRKMMTEQKQEEPKPEDETVEG